MVRLMVGIATLLIPGAGFAAETAGDAPPQPNMLLQLGPLILLMVVFFFFTSRSQKKKQKQHDQMLSSISRGDTVVTSGGIFGKVCEILDDSFLIEISEGARARVLKSSVSSKRESGEGTKPRKLKKKRRVVRKETTTDAGAPARIGSDESPKVPDEGVSAEENEALTNGPDVGVDDEKNVPAGTKAKD
ncbi:MAG: preprotein translocase subunit YajC [Synergistaceae bacterium]|nr:preprotein translocase subunit YajC [Synergistaceae bacterium]